MSPYATDPEARTLQLRGVPGAQPPNQAPSVADPDKLIDVYCPKLQNDPAEHFKPNIKACIIMCRSCEGLPSSWASRGWLAHLCNLGCNRLSHCRH